MVINGVENKEESTIVVDNTTDVAVKGKKNILDALILGTGAEEGFAVKKSITLSNTLVTITADTDDVLATSLIVTGNIVVNRVVANGLVAVAISGCVSTETEGVTGELIDDDKLVTLGKVNTAVVKVVLP